MSLLVEGLEPVTTYYFRLRVTDSAGNETLSGEVTEINDALPDNPELVNSDPYGMAWMLRIQMSDPAELEQMMDAAAYQQNTEERSG